MNRLEQLHENVRELSKSDFDAFKAWLLEHEYERWTHQIESDSMDDKSPIMQLAARALLEHKIGKTKAL